jgi:hypothetical protein
VTDLDTLVRSGLREAAASVDAPDTGALTEALRSASPARRHRSLPLLVAAAVVVVVAIATVVAWPDAEPGQDVRAGAPSSTTTAPVIGFQALGAGWHELDTGPVAADSGHQLVWTGRELVVIGGAGRTWRYRPSDRTWSEAWPAPLPRQSTGWSPGGAVWTGDRVVAVFVDGSTRWSASWDPAADHWTPIGEVPIAPELTAAVGTTGVPVSGGAALLWSGERVFDVAHLASLDPEAGRWEPLPLPVDLVRYASLLSSNAVFDGEEVVFTNLLGPGLAWDAAATAQRQVPSAPTTLSGLTDVVPTSTAGAIGGQVVLVSDGGAEREPAPGRVLALDASAGRWRRLPDAPEVSGTLGCPRAATAVGNLLVVPRCGARGIVVFDGGRWVDGGTGAPDGSCCLGRLVDAGGALVAWESDTDTINNPEAPYVRAAVWVPPR